MCGSSDVRGAMRSAPFRSFLPSYLTGRTLLELAGVGRTLGGAAGRTQALVVTRVGGGLGIEDAVDEALFELRETGCLGRADRRAGCNS